MLASFVRAGDGYYERIGKGFEQSFNTPAFPIGVGVTFSSHYFDDPMRNFGKGQLLPDKVSWLGDHYGGGANFLIGNIYALAEGLSSNRHKDDTLENMQLITESFAATMAVTFIAKNLFDRNRPDQSNNKSFPSGHTSGSFVVAASLQQLYGARIGVPAYALAIITGLQRIHADRHWLSDVLAGALLGTLIGNGFAQLKDNESNDFSEPLGKNYHVSFYTTF